MTTDRGAEIDVESQPHASAERGADLASLAAFQQLVLERSHDLITVVDLAGAIVYASPSWRKLGWDPDTLAGRHIMELIHPDDRGLGAEAMAGVTSGEPVESVTARHLRADGGWLWFESSGAPIFDQAGNVAYLLGTARDVSEREELRQRIAETDALYRIANAIARAGDLDELLAEAVETLIEATGADRAAVLLYDADDVVRFHAWRGLSDEYRSATEGHSPWPRDATDAQPVLVADVADGGFDEELERVVRNEGIAALAFIPLVHGERLIGKFMLYHDAPHPWSDREVLLCRTIAAHLASATVRTRAQEALRASGDQLATILRTVQEGILVQSPSGYVVYANDAAARMMEVESPGDVVGEHRERMLEPFEIFDVERRPLEPDDLPARHALRGEPAERVIGFRVRGSGEERWSVSRSSPIFAADGSVELAVSVFYDITEMRRAEERVRFLGRASELLNETLDIDRTFGALADLAVPAFASHVTVDLYTDGVLRCVGARHVDPLKTELMLRLRERYPPTVAEHPVQRALRTGELQFVPDVQAEAVTMAHDEEHVRGIRELANASGIVVPLIARGRTFGAITFGTVPPQPRFVETDLELAAELGQRASVALDNAILYDETQGRAHAAQALEFVDDGVVLLDRDGVVRLWNPAAVKTFRVTPQDAIGRPVAELIPRWADLRERVHVATEPTAGAHRATTLPVEVRGEERWLAVSAVAFPGGVVYAFRDLTEERAVDQLKSDFVSTVSHELRTPLAAIYGAALTLQRDDVRLEESQRQGLLDVISGEADRLARIVNDILWASRLDSGQMGVEIESCDAAGITHKVVKALRSHAPAGVAIEVAAAHELPPVAADPDKLRQVLTNLVDNGVKYSPDGGRVRITLERDDARVRFAIADEGLGIPPSEQGRIFEKFFRLDPNLTRGVGGTGLGLYICRELVERMDGRIWVDSDGRHGSTFFVELPVAE